MLENFKMPRCNMSVKMLFFHSHLDYLLENLSNLSEEHGERFHQYIKETDWRCHRRWNAKTMTDFYWEFEKE